MDKIAIRGPGPDDPGEVYSFDDPAPIPAPGCPNREAEHTCETERACEAALAVPCVGGGAQ
jgi:hypothetical protein